MEQKMLMFLSEHEFSLRYVPAPLRIRHHLATAALVSLRDGLDMLGEIQHRLDGQGEQQASSHNVLQC